MPEGNIVSVLFAVIGVLIAVNGVLVAMLHSNLARDNDDIDRDKLVTRLAIASIAETSEKLDVLHAQLKEANTQITRAVEQNDLLLNPGNPAAAHAAKAENTEKDAESAKPNPAM